MTTAEPRPPRRQPILNLPPLTKALLITNVAIHLLRLALPMATDIKLVLNLAFVPARYTLSPAVEWQAVVAPITYQFLHGGAMHLIMNMLVMAAFGAGVERRMGVLRTLVFYLACGVAGALAHLAAYPTSFGPVVGASAGISGLFGGVLWIIRQRHEQRSRQRLFTLAVIWIALAAATGIMGMPGDGDVVVAWVAHIGGFVAGLILFPLLLPRTARPHGRA